MEINKSRTRSAILNALFGVVSFVIILLMNLATRKLFAKYLGEEYLGLNSLFSNIISMLSLTELGIGSAIIIFLYKPVEEGDKEKIKTYMQFYRKAYMFIAGAVLLIGFIVFFFLPIIVKTTLQLNEVRFYYILYVANTAVSYLMAYRKSILYADQNNRVLSVTHMGSKILIAVSQIVLLLIYKSFTLFVIAMIVGTVLENATCLFYVRKKYPFLREKEYVKLSKEELKEIWKKILPLLVQNVALFLVDSTDNIIISSFIGVGVVGKYSNYVLIISTFSTLYSQVSSAFTVGFGNMTVSASVEKCEDIYCKFHFLTFWIITMFSFCYIAVIQQFIDVWLGTNYELDIWVPVLLIISFYLKSMSIPGLSAQNSMGLHSKDMWYVVAQGVGNIVLSIILVQFIGVHGVILGTIICKLLTTAYSKDVVLYKYFFKKSPKKIFMQKIMYSALSVALTTGGYFLFRIVWLDNVVVDMIVKMFVSVIMINLILIVLTFRTNSFRYFYGVAKKIIIKIFSARRGNQTTN